MAEDGDGGTNSVILGYTRFNLLLTPDPSNQGEIWKTTNVWNIGSYIPDLLSMVKRSGGFQYVWSVDWRPFHHKRVDTTRTGVLNNVYAREHELGVLTNTGESVSQYWIAYLANDGIRIEMEDDRIR